MDQVRSDSQQDIAFLARFADPVNIAMLQVSDTAMDDFKRVSGSSMREISTLQERNG